MPFGYADNFWSNWQNYLTDSAFYEGWITGIQADATVSPVECMKSFTTTVTAVNAFKDYSVSTYTTALSNTHVSTYFDFGFYSMYFKKFNEISLSFFDTYA